MGKKGENGEMRGRGGRKGSLGRREKGRNERKRRKEESGGRKKKRKREKVG